MSGTIENSDQAQAATDQPTPAQSSWLANFLGKGSEIVETAGQAVNAVADTATQAYAEISSFVASAPQKVAQAYHEGEEALNKLGRTVVGNPNPTPVQTDEERERAKREAIAEVQRREKAARDYQNELDKKYCEEMMEQIHAKQQAEVEQKQREEADRKALQEEYEDIRRSLRPIR